MRGRSCMGLPGLQSQLFGTMACDVVEEPLTAGGTAIVFQTPFLPVDNDHFCYYLTVGLMHAARLRALRFRFLQPTSLQRTSMSGAQSVPPSQHGHSKTSK